ncbi:MAG: metal-binding protein [Candidatus Bipolaricaulota bacterium]|nr:metal-binding protein [Candidatus Bipolaricaulota bacterium]
MPSGKTHLRIELLVLPLWVALFYFFVDASWHAGAVFAGAYLFSSLLLSPDLDLRHNRSRRRWGVLGFIWVPYTKVFKHRGISHSLLLGTLTRLGYLGVLALFIAFGLSYLRIWAIPVDSLTAAPFDLKLVGILVAGLWLPNIIHTITDRVHSALRRGV